MAMHSGRNISVVKPMVATRHLTISIVCLLVFVLNNQVKAQSSNGLEWGDAVDGVQMSIGEAGVVKPGVPILKVVFRNLRDKPINLVLGFVGGSGPRPCKLDNRQITCTLNFNLFVTDPAGVARKYTFRGITFVAGRLEDYLVRLEADSTWALELGLDQFWSPATREYDPLTLRPARYQLSLQFEGRGVKFVNIDQKYLEKMTFWTGTLTSNLLTIQSSR
jgi:hypothetical protein